MIVTLNPRQAGDNNNKSPQSHLGRARRYPHIGECTVPLRVLDVACTMRNEALRKRYGTVTENIDFAPH